MSRRLVGFSTGCLFPSHTVAQALEAFRGAMDLVELSFATPAELRSLPPSVITGYHRTTLHAPFKGIRWTEGSETQQLLGLLDLWAERNPNLSVVFHPDTIDDLGCLNGRKFRPCLENMDSRKTRGIRPEEFEQWRADFDGGFVLDVQHAWEHDPSMGLARELADCFGDRLSHLHVSGCLGVQGHSLLQKADNASSILEFLSEYLSLDVVLEGPLSALWKKEITQELGVLDSEGAS